MKKSELRNIIREEIEREQLNEDLFNSILIMGQSAMVGALLFQLIVGYMSKMFDKTGKSKYLSWKPKDIINNFKTVRRDNKIIKIVDRLKNDSDIQEFLRNPKKGEWQKLIKTKVKPEELKYVNGIWKRHFDNSDYDYSDNPIN